MRIGILIILFFSINPFYVIGQEDKSNLLKFGFEFGGIYNEVNSRNSLNLWTGSYGVYLGGVLEYGFKGQRLFLRSGLRNQLRAFNNWKSLDISVPLNLKIKLIENEIAGLSIIAGFDGFLAFHDKLDRFTNNRRIYFGSRIGIELRALTNSKTITKMQIFRYGSKNSYYSQRTFINGTRGEEQYGNTGIQLGVVQMWK